MCSTYKYDMIHIDQNKIETDRQTDRQTDRLIYNYIYIYTIENMEEIKNNKPPSTSSMSSPKGMDKQRRNMW